jgi:hypothetical protein
VESSIIMLDDWTDQATKQLLQNVVERKKKYEKMKKMHLLFLWFAVFYSFGYLYVLYYTIIEPYSYSLWIMLSKFFQHSYQLYTFLIAVGLFGGVKIYHDKKEKAETEFHALRCEIIDRSKDLWRNEGWMNRHKVFQMMKDKYDINLYHESK